jgi:hypothetical protein
MENERLLANLRINNTQGLLMGGTINLKST